MDEIIQESDTKSGPRCLRLGSKGVRGESSLSAVTVTSQSQSPDASLTTTLHSLLDALECLHQATKSGLMVPRILNVYRMRLLKSFVSYVDHLLVSYLDSSGGGAPI